MNKNFTVRKGVPGDIPRTLELIKELAHYEKAPEAVELSEEELLNDGFGEHPIYTLYVAEDNRGVQGIAIYYFRYSTWKGKTLYLEDIVVTQSERGRGIGQALFDLVVSKAKDEGCRRMSWQVLDWNEPAINFYKKYGASLDGEWINCDLYADQINQH